MAENEAKAVRVSDMPVEQVKHTIKAAKLLFSAPHYILRGPIYLVCVICVVAIIYAFIGEKDEIVAAPLALKSEFSTIQAPTGGIINRIYVSEGSVIAGYDLPLVDVQFQTQASVGSEQDQLKEKLDRLNDELRWQGRERKEQEKRITDMKSDLRREKEGEGILEDRIRKERKAYEESLTSARSKVKIIRENRSVLDKQFTQRKSTVDTRQKEYDTFVDEYKKEKKLFDQKLSTEPQLAAKKLTMIRGKEALDNSKTSLSQTENEINKLKIQLEEALGEPDKLKNEWESKELSHHRERANSKERVSDLNSRIKQAELGMEKGREELLKQKKKLEKQIEKAMTLIQGVRYRGDICQVSSVYAGEVLEVFIKPGELISRGQPMFKVKKQTHLIFAEILVQNRDIGKLKKNDEVKIKYAAYPYQEFGIQKGRIRFIPSQPAQVEGFGSVYKVEVALDKETVTVHKKEQDLALGLEGLGEIKVGAKKLIAVVFSPLAKFLHPEDE